MPHLDTTSHPELLATSPLATVEERERRLIDAVVALARSLRDERDRLAQRLNEVERELGLLVAKLDAKSERQSSVGRFSDRGIDARAGQPLAPSRTRG